MVLLAKKLTDSAVVVKEDVKMNVMFPPVALVTVGAAPVLNCQPVGAFMVSVWNPLVKSAFRPSVTTISLSVV